MLSLENTPFAGQELEDLDTLFPVERLAIEPKVLNAYVETTEALRVYNSASIEGNSLTLEEVVVVLETNSAIFGKPYHDTQEVQRLARALRYAGALAANKVGFLSPFMERDMLDIHALVLGEPHGGHYRTQQVYILGSKYKFPKPQQLIEQVDKMMEWLPAVQGHPILGALVVHTWFVQIHPFIDGNGRTARALAELIMRCHGLPPVTLPVEIKSTYFQAMESSWTDLRPLARLWRECFEQSLKTCDELRS